MFSSKKSSNIPGSLSEDKYSGDDVHEQLKIDFFDKCYICGGKVSAREVEHFVPHTFNPSLKYEWSNLFLACGYCNGRKSTTYNKDGKDILNPIIDKIEDHIKHKIIPFHGTEPIFEKIVNDSKTGNTIELLEKVFTKKRTNNMRQELENRKMCSELIKEMKRLERDYEEYSELKSRPQDVDYVEYEKRLAKHFSKMSPFCEFKLGFLDLNHVLKSDVKSAIQVHGGEAHYNI